LKNGSKAIAIRSFDKKLFDFAARVGGEGEGTIGRRKTAEKNSWQYSAKGGGGPG